MIDYSKQMEHLGAEMTAQQKTDAILNGVWNAIGELIAIAELLEKRIIALEAKNEQP